MISKVKMSLACNELRLEAQFCDAVIKVEDVEFPVHKVILCNCTNYFRALFERWSYSDQKVFTIPGLSPHMMQLIIEYAYIGSVSVTEDNVQELLLAADQLNVMDVVQMCCNFLEEQLCPQNCIGIWQFTNICYCPELQCKAYRYIIDHFEEVVLSEEYMQLSVQELADILERDDLNVKQESTVFEAMTKWINHAPTERDGHIAVLLSKVRLGLLSADYLRLNVLPNQLVDNSVECWEIIDSFTRHSAAVENPSGFYNSHVTPRLPNAILLAIGGWSGRDLTNSIEAYDVQADCWINITNNFELPRVYHGAVFLNGYIYCAGGFNGIEHFNSVCRFDLSTRTWQEVSPMYYRRCYVSVTVMNGCIYAMGGYNGQMRLNSAEYYQPEINQWTVIANMHEQRSDASCTTLHNKVYICGGFNGNECLQTAECYSPETNQWTVITPMSSRRSGIAVIAYADQIYAVGGFDGNTCLRSAEAYNTHTNTWHHVSSMITPRSNFGFEILGNCLFVVGGFNGFTITNNVEYYDALTEEWSEACDMEIFRSELSCCVVSRLPNMADYAAPRNALLPSPMEDEMEQSGDPV